MLVTRAARPETPSGAGPRVDRRRLLGRPPNSLHALNLRLRQNSVGPKRQKRKVGLAARNPKKELGQPVWS
jgi:hypothetical protein